MRWFLAAVLLLLVSLTSKVFGQAAMPLNSVYVPFDWVYSTAYSPTGKMIAVGGSGGVQLFEAPSGTFIRAIPTEQYITAAVAFSPDGTKLLIGTYGQFAEYGGGGAVELWDVATGSLIQTYSTAAGFVLTLAFSPDGKSFLAGGYYQPIVISTTGVLEEHNIATGAGTNYNVSAFFNVKSAAYSPDGKSIAAGGSIPGQEDGPGGGELQLWKVGVTAPTKTLSTSLQVFVAGIAFSPDGKVLADAGSNGSTGTVELWNTATGTLLRSMSESRASLFCIAFSPNGADVASGGDIISGGGCPLDIWQVSNGDLLLSITNNDAEIESLKYSPDGATLIVGDNRDDDPFTPVLDFYKPATGTLLTTSSLRMAIGIGAIAFTPDEKKLCASGGGLALWNVADGSLATLLNPDPKYSVNCMAFTPNGATLAGGRSLGVDLWSMAAGKITATLTSNAYVLASLCVSPDSKTLVVGGTRLNNREPGVVEVWDLVTNKLLYSLATQANQVTSVAYNRDNETVAVGGAGALNGQGVGVVELWNATTGKLIRSLPSSASNGVQSVAFSPDGRTLVDSGGIYPYNNPVLEPWDVSSGALITAVNDSATSFLGPVVVEPDGKAIFAGESFGDLQSFGTLPYALLSTYTQLSTQGCTAVAISASGKYVAVNPRPSSGPYYYGFAIHLNPYYGYIPASALTLSPNPVLGTQSTTGTVTISAPATSFTNIVSLSSNSPCAVVPPFVTVPAGATQVTFPITTSNVTNTVPVLITASSNGVKVSAQIKIASVIKVGAAASVVGGGSTTGTVTLSSAAPTGGATVNLASNAAWVTVPPTATVSAGSTSATFKISTSGVPAPSPATVSASLEGATVTTSITVNPAVMTGVSLSHASVVGGSTTTLIGTVDLNGLAPSAGDTVTLSSSSIASASVPGSMVVPSGAKSATFNVTTYPVVSSTGVTISAMFAGVTKTVKVTVTPMTVTAFSVSPASVVGGKTVTGKVQLGLTVTSATTVKLSTTSSVVSMPSTVTIPAGASSATFTVSTSAVKSATSANLVATLGSSTKSAVITINP